MLAEEQTGGPGLETAYRPQYQQVAEHIIDFIVASRLKPGERLPTEQALGERFGVSRSVVREAVKYLTATGLVGVRKGFGVYVAGQTPGTLHLSLAVEPDQVQALFEFRGQQEMLTTRLAATHITLAELREMERLVAANWQAAEGEQLDTFILSDNQFHQAIAQATHNPFFIETIKNVISLQRWAVKLAVGGYPGSLRESAQQHMAIFEALRNGQQDEAAHAMQQHIDSVYQAYRQEVKRRLLDDQPTH